MKVAILAGGVGTRLAEETEVKPKPMVEVGGRPILWHIMQHYARYGHKEFYVALGYKGEYIKNYMLDYCAAQGNLTVNLKTGEVSRHGNNAPDWTVNLIETGQATLTGGRIKRLQPYLDSTFMLTWGDGVSNVNLDDLLAFHRAHGKLATVTAVRPTARFGHLVFDGDRLTGFMEKPQTAEGWINGAFFVLEPGIFDYIAGDDTQWEREPMEGLARDGQLMAYRHAGFWQCMDTLRDKKLLQDLWDAGNAALENLEWNMKVIVTGHLGYIGTVLAPMLQRAGHYVMGIDSDLYRRCTFGHRLPRVPTLYKDIRDLTGRELQGYDAVLHLAGLSNDPLGDLDPDLTYDINYRASVRLAEMAKAAGVSRYIFSSSCSNYGAGGQDMLTEESPFNPVTPYGKSKVMVEQEVAKMADDSFSPVFLRNATAYGYSPRIRFDLVVNNLTAWAYTTGKVFLKSDGSAWRPIVHIEDISRAFLAALEAPREAVHGQAFNVARADQNFRIRELAEIVGKTVPNSRVEFSTAASADTRCYRVNCEKIRRVLPAFQPTWTAQDGARELLGAYVEHGVTLEEFEGPKFQRVAHIRWLMSQGLIDGKLRVRAPLTVAPTPVIEMQRRASA